MEYVEMTLERDPLALDDELNYDLAEQSEDKLYCCQVCNMILIGFSRFTPEEQVEIIKNGRPMPKMKTLCSNNAITGHSFFCSERYINYEWLTGCEQRSKLFCWPCLLFTEKTDPWTTTGISDLINLTHSIKKHSIWDVHIDAMFKWKTFGKTSTSIAGDEDGTSDEDESLKEEEIVKNREILKRFIHIVLFLGVQEMCQPEEGEDNLMDPIDQTRYEAFVNYIGKYDHFLASQLTCNKMFLSISFRNNLISSVANVVTKHILDETSQSSFLSMILDEVAEKDDTTLISTTIRFTNAKGELVERFLNFRKVPSYRKADSMFSVINDNVNTLDCASKLVSVSCDGGVVRTNELFDFQAKIRNVCPNVCFLHYYEHRINTVLAQSLSSINECKLFFWTLNGLALSFFKSNKLKDDLNLLIRKNNPDAKDFRWNFNGSLINNVLKIRQPLIDLFQSIVDCKDSWDFESVSASHWFLPKLTSDLSFNFLLLLLGDIFERADVLSSNLILNCDNVGLCVQHVKEYTHFIRRKKDSFSLICWEALKYTSSSKEEVNDSQLKYKMEACKQIINSVLSNIIAQLNSRFIDLWRMSFLSLLTDFKNKKNSDTLKATLTHPFKELFDHQSLGAELSVLSNSDLFKKSTEREMLKYLRHMELASTFPQTTKLCELSITLPVSEGNSTLERIANYIQTTSVAHRQSPMTILKIEKDYIDELEKNPKFYDEIIEEFSKKEPSIPLLLKA